MWSFYKITKINVLTNKLGESPCIYIVFKINMTEKVMFRFS